MKISIVDPGLNALSGHHFDQDYRLAIALGRLGADVEVHALRSAEPEVEKAFLDIGISFHRTFRIGTYEGVTPGAEDLNTCLTYARQTEEDLRGLPPTDVAYWPSLGPFQLLAMTRQPYGSRRIGGLDGNINGFTDWGAELINQAARILAQTGGKVTLGAYDRRMADVYAPLLHPLAVGCLPVPYDFRPRVATVATAPRRIGFFGHQRPERGIEMLPDLIRELIDRGKLVVMHDSGLALNVSGEHPNLTVLGFTNDIAAEIAACDLVVWPSDAASYATRTSGIVWTAIATGTPLVMPALCLPARIALERGAAVFFGTNCLPSIAEAIGIAERGYPALLELAGRRALEWSRTEGIERLALRIISGDSAP